LTWQAAAAAKYMHTKQAAASAAAARVACAIVDDDIVDVTPLHTVGGVGSSGGGAAASSSTATTVARPLGAHAPRPVFLWVAGAGGVLPQKMNPLTLLNGVGEGVGPVPGLSGGAGCFDSCLFGVRFATDVCTRRCY
jgi:hypothetical protein